MVGSRGKVEPMQIPLRPSPRETTEAMVRNIARELAETERAISRCRGDRVAEPRLTGTWLAHLLISSKELLQLIVPGKAGGSGCENRAAAQKQKGRNWVRQAA